MKKLFLIALMACGTIAGHAQTKAYQAPRFDQNWSLGLDAGVATPLKHHAFFGDMRGSFGVHIQKQLSPVFALGAEATFAINTASWLQNDPRILAAGYDLTGHSKSAIDRF